MWSEISYLKILLWMPLVMAAYWILRVVVFAKKPKRTPTETNLKNEGDTRLNLPASEANPAKKATVRIGLPPTPDSKQTIRISMPPKQGQVPMDPYMAACVDELDKPPKQGQVPVDPYGTVTSPIIPTHSTVDGPNGGKYGITGPSPLPIAHPGMLPAPVPVRLGIQQVVFRMRILQQLWEEQLVNGEEYQEKKEEILRNL
jgi:hypothetical protein